MGLLALLFVAFFVLAIGFAIWKGGAPERIVAMSFWAASFLTITVSNAITNRFRHANAGVVTIDVLLLAILLIVAFKANRRWTLLVASLQILIVIGHVMKAWKPSLVPAIYMIITQLWPFLQLMTLAVGTEMFRRAKRSGRNVRSWSASSIR